MQAITLSINKKGIDYLADKIISAAAIQFLATMTPPDIDIDIESFSPPPDMSGYYIFRQPNIHLSKGMLSQCEALFKGIKIRSGIGAKFDLCFAINDFSANYQWQEAYHLFWKMTRQGEHRNKVIDKGERIHHYKFSPLFAALTINTGLKFSYQAESKCYVVMEDSIVGNAETSRHNIPQDSILQVQPLSCFNTELGAAITKMLKALGLPHYLCEIFNKTFTSIPRSGQLAQNIHFDFSFADAIATTRLRLQKQESGREEGLSLSVSGGMQWIDNQGQAHTYEEPLPNLPHPSIAAENDALPININISNYGINAALWAYFKSGRFNVSLKPEDLKNPNLLHANTYENIAPIFKYHRRIDMHLNIKPMATPTTHFRPVFAFTNQTMALLEKKFPDDIFKRLEALHGKTLLDQKSLNHALKDCRLNAQQISTVEDLSTQPGLILNHIINFTITMQDDNTDHHKIDYEIELCTGISKLALSPHNYLLPKQAFSKLEKKGMSEETRNKIKTLIDLPFASEKLLHKALGDRLSETESTDYLDDIVAQTTYPVQTVTFAFQAIAHTASKVELVATTIPGFANYRIGALIWESIGSIKYAKILANIGKTGIPLPTIKNFNYHFESAELQIEESYITIATDIEHR